MEERKGRGSEGPGSQRMGERSVSDIDEEKISKKNSSGYESDPNEVASRHRSPVLHNKIRDSVLRSSPDTGKVV